MKILYKDNLHVRHIIVISYIFKIAFCVSYVKIVIKIGWPFKNEYNGTPSILLLDPSRVMTSHHIFIYVQYYYGQSLHS